MELPEYISRKNFEKAVMYEQNYDYEKAIEFYGKVKPKDEANYSAAASKIGDLTASLEINKTVASAINAAIETKSAECLFQTTANRSASLFRASGITFRPKSLKKIIIIPLKKTLLRGFS